MRTDVATDVPSAPESVSGPAFPILIKALSTMMILGMVYWGAGVLREVVWAEVSSGAAVLLGSAFLITVTAWLWMLKSRTSISHETIEQTWLWHKRVLIKDITQAKLIHVPYLNWLIAPRLIVRAGVGLNVFYTADPIVLKAFALLVRGKAK